MTSTLSKHAAIPTELDTLQSESIHILREVAGEFDRPVILFSGGKDSVLVLHLARKAFHPAPLPFALLHVDTGHNFPEVLEYRDRVVAQGRHRLHVAKVQDWIDDGRLAERPDGTRNPLQTVPLLDSINELGFDAVIGGARRDEERSRAKERIFSLRDAFGGWDPRRQRPEPWHLYNGRHAPGEHVRVFPLSNWTELDVWRYIEREGIELPDIYYAHRRDVFSRNGMWLTAGEWGGPRAAEQVQSRMVRYRTVGDMSCTGAVDSEATDVDAVIDEIVATRITERGATRADDQLTEAAMEDRKREGYFLMAGTHTLLRFATAGSVDDGKSTLVGRLLYDSKVVLSDTLAAAERTSAARGQASVDLSLLVDGLRAEREQGITIDVAYRYFATDKRTFILADTPGHVQYTRNTVTGASTADVIIILVDARTGVVAQTRRHATVAALLGVPEILLAVNKIDLVDYDQAAFDRISAEFADYATALGIPAVVGIPISALNGDNVVDRSDRIDWYAGPSVLEHLESVEVRDLRSEEPLRFPVQYVIRPGSDHHDPDYRGYAGRVASGTVRAGDEVVVLPGGQRTTVSRVETADGAVDVATAGDSVTLLLDDDLDIARGNLVAAPGASEPVSEFAATIAQVSEKPLRAGQRALLKYGTTTTRVVVGSIDHLLDIDTLTELDGGAALQLNDIGLITLRTAEPLAVDDYQPGGAVGALLVIDPADGATLAVGMVGDRRAAIIRGPGQVAARCRSVADSHDAPTPGP